MSDRYDDIISLPNFKAPNRVQMPLSSRAAQFAPFKALTGYEDSISEAERLTESEPELSEESRAALDRTLRYLSANLDKTPEITAEYFVHDPRKDGGSYMNYTGNLRLIDYVNRKLVFAGGFSLDIDSITLIKYL